VPTVAANSDSHRRPLTEGLPRAGGKFAPCAGRAVPAGVVPAALHQQGQSYDQRKQKCALAGRQISGMASYENCCGGSDGAMCGIPSTSRRATTRQPRGQSRITHVPVSSRAAPGWPCGRCQRQPKTDPLAASARGSVFTCRRQPGCARSTGCHTSTACKSCRCSRGRSLSEVTDSEAP
jgi:hypothetical protein